MPALLLFDIDKTLVSTLRVGRTAVDRGFEKEFGITDAIADILVDGRTDYAIFKEIITNRRLAEGQDLEAAIRRAARAYLEQLPGAIAERKGDVLPGVVELLDALTESHPAVGLATGNMARGAQIKLGAFGLWERFAAGGFGDDTAVRAELVEQGMKALAVSLGRDPDPADTLVIGDTPLDVEAAHAIGARALAVATGKYDVEILESTGAEWVLPDLADTARVLEILRA